MQEPSEHALIGKTLGGRYRLDGLLGHGGFADVFRAWDNLDDVYVACKVLKTPEHLSAAAQRDFVARFHEEAKLTRKIFKGMAHVRQVLDMGVADLEGEAQPWMAMELLEGETLHEWLRRRRTSPRPPTRLTPREALGMLRPVLEAAAFAHERGVAHRDLKPANVFLVRAEDGGAPSVKVLDFGIAKVLQGDEAASGNTMTSSALQMFSPQYGAPEQFAGKKTGKYTDVFALGLMMTELCTDKAPLSEAGDRTECMMAALDKHDRPTPKLVRVEVPAALEAVLRRAVALKEAERHADAGELLRELDAAIPSGATEDRKPEAPEEAPRARKKKQPKPPEPVIATSFAENLPSFDPSARPPERGKRDKRDARGLPSEPEPVPSRAVTPGASAPWSGRSIFLVVGGAGAVLTIVIALLVSASTTTTTDDKTDRENLEILRKLHEAGLTSLHRDAATLDASPEPPATASRLEKLKTLTGIPAPPDVASPPLGAQTTASGLRYRVLQRGTGTTRPNAKSKVTVHYTGWTTDGKMFDSSISRGEQASFSLESVIRGWTEALQLMVVGEKTRFWIPAELAYGTDPKNARIAGMLVFDIELFKIE